MSLISADSFNRANGAPGSTDGAGSLDPRAWTTQEGTFVIFSNQLAATAVAATITCDLATANVDLQMTHVASDVNGQGIVCRFSDTSNYFVMLGDTNKCDLVRRQAGSNTTIISTASALAAGTVMRLTASGNALTMYLDGTQIGTTTDSFNSSATKHGVRHQGTSQLTDVWSANTLPVTTVTGTQATETDSGTSATLWAVRSGVIQFIPPVTTS